VQLTITTYAVTPSTLTLADGTSSNPFALVSDSLDWGNSQFQHAYSGPRGTQGARAASGIPQNRTVTLPIRVYGQPAGSTTAKDSLAANIRTLNSVTEDLRKFGGKLTWQSVGQSYKQSLEVITTDGAQLQTWTNRTETRSIAAVNLQLVCAPHAIGDSMDVSDQTFSTYTTDYSLDAGAFANLSNTGGKITATANQTVEHRLIHTQRGYQLADTEVTVKAAVGSTLSSWKAGAILWRTSATDYVTVYVDDNGTNSRLRIDQSISGTVTNRSSVNLASRLTAGSPGSTVYVRARSEGTTVYAEYWTSAPTPSGTPTLSTSWAASSAWTATTFTQGAIVTYQGYQYVAASATLATDVPSGAATSTAKWSYLAGLTGITFTPQTAVAEIDYFIVRPFTYTNGQLPRKISLQGIIPGDSPALGNLEITTSQDASWAMVGWSSKSAPTSLVSTPTPAAPFQILNGDASDSTTRSGWTTTNALGLLWNNSAFSSATTYSAKWILDPSLLPIDEYTTGDRAVEVWALILTDLSSRLVSPNIVASLQSKDGYGPTRYTDEYGTAGRTVPVMSSTATGSGYRWTRLGTLHVGNTTAREMALTLTGTAAATSSTSSAWGIARVIVLPVKQRATLPTAKHAAEFGPDSTYSKWTPAATTTSYSLATTYPAGQLVVFGTSSSYSASVATYSASATYTTGTYIKDTTGQYLYVAATNTTAGQAPTGAATSNAQWTYVQTLPATTSNTVYRAKNAITTTSQQYTLPQNNSTDWEAFQMSRQIASDLTTTSWQPTVATAPLLDRSIGGVLPELPPGALDLIVALSKVVPDDPVASIATEDILYPYVASVHVSIRPRFDQLRTVA